MKMLKNSFTFVLLGSAFLLTMLNSCSHDSVGVEASSEVCFQKDVLPIFLNSCTMSGCHGQGSDEGGFKLTDYDGIMNGIRENDPKRSKIYNVITNMWINTMPPSPHQVLSKEQRTTIALWILQGAKNTTCF